ncbi:MAG: hypothetical protein JWL84_987 [Rhodospirillales bacterium]|jgi:hypothetical protein|nr:hypothetical protein [Rhodospirillales bacterium]
MAPDRGLTTLMDWDRPAAKPSRAACDGKTSKNRAGGATSRAASAEPVSDVIRPSADISPRQPNLRGCLVHSTNGALQ